MFAWGRSLVGRLGLEKYLDDEYLSCAQINKKKKCKNK